MREWLELAKEMKGVCDKSLLDPSRQIGWLKHAFVLSFCYLLVPGMTYEKAIRDTLLLAGDTDTNAAIVGGMIGAAVGIDGLPKSYVDKVLKCDLL